ncbi:IclR family transcriptional regulator [Nocardia sp. R16R-3T]
MARTTQRVSPTEQRRPSPTVPAAARAMSLFETFAIERRAMSKSELARLLDLPESSTSDLLNTLLELGYVTRTVATRRFYPTGRLFTVARSIVENDQIGAFAEEAVGHLAARTSETAVFAVVDGDRIRVVGAAQGKHRLRYMVHVGDTFSIHGTGVGKALLATMEPAERGRLLRLKPLAKLTPNTLTDPREIEADIQKASPRGWFGTRDEGTVGVSSIAVWGRMGLEFAALGIIGPTDRIVGSEQALIDQVLETRATVFGSEE